MRGKIYCIGVGPGDPELMTLKTVRILREVDVVAAPGKVVEETIAFKIAAQAVPEIAEKRSLPLDAPMVREPGELAAAHAASAATVAELLDQGLDVAYLTLGDPTLYCSFSYLQDLLGERGFEVKLVSGVTSISAAAARAGIPLAQWDEPLRVIPAAHADVASLADQLAQPGTCVFMKPSANLPAIKEAISTSGREVITIERCGLENERIHRGADAIPDELPYLSIIIVR
ncbi:MAG: precorrin-2 C(20)-methyltransferase [Coriobacteriales bacterium]|jgi:precorrin-2/cobalt-factor-2 C20-methyltransferase